MNYFLLRSRNQTRTQIPQRNTAPTQRHAKAPGGASPSGLREGYKAKRVGAPTAFERTFTAQVLRRLGALAAPERALCAWCASYATPLQCARSSRRAKGLPRRVPPVYPLNGLICGLPRQTSPEAPSEASRSPFRDLKVGPGRFRLKFTNPYHHVPGHSVTQITDQRRSRREHAVK